MQLLHMITASYALLSILIRVTFAAVAPTGNVAPIASSIVSLGQSNDSSSLPIPANVGIPYLIPDTKFPITLYITEGAPLSLRKSATAFQAMMELMAVISARDQDMVYPGAYAPYIYLDCQVMVDNPALQHEMTYYVAIQSLKGLGEYMLEHEGDRGYVARVGVDGYQVGLVDLRHAELAEQ